MRTGAVTGCCNSMNFYNLGGAHGHRTAKDQNEFEDWLAARGHESINIAITNSEQSKTRTYLEAAGWKTEKVAHLWISTISGNDLNKVKQRVWARQAEEQKRALEQKRKLEAERLAMRAALKFSPGTDVKVYPGKVLYEDIWQLCDRTHPYTIRANRDALAIFKARIEEKYLVKLDNISYMTAHDLRQHVYDKVYQARKRFGIL